MPPAVPATHVSTGPRDRARGPGLFAVGLAVGAALVGIGLPSGEATPSPGPLARDRLFPAGAILTAPATAGYVCHDLTFAGGAASVPLAAVEARLATGGYRVVGVPRAGDVVAYRGEDGLILHTGVVRVVTASGVVVVESKWGAGPQYLHPADVEWPVRTTRTYHRPPPYLRRPVARG